MNSASDGHDLSGITLDGRYTLIRRLGEGAMGQVYDAHHGALDRRVAVKVLHKWLAEQRRYRKRFLREARAASRIKHPNVVEILDYGGTPNDSVYLVMEFLEGCDLKGVLRAGGRLQWPRARHFLLQAVAALRAAHRQDVIHRDIKPANCFICTPAEPGLPERMKLLDFGIAKFDADPSASASMGDRGITQTGELIGTLAYMAPEFAEGKPASPHTDMYALGVMAYELVTGTVPFLGRNEFQVLARHLNEPPVRPCAVVPEIPPAVELLVLTMLAKTPEGRYRSMAELEQAILAIPGDADEDTPLVVPREATGPRPAVRPREGSGPRTAARREASGPRTAARREASGPRTAARREASGPRTAARRETSGPRTAATREPSGPRGAARREPSGPSAADLAGEDEHRTLVGYDHDAESPPTEPDVRDRWSEVREVDEPIRVRRQPLEWGTIATIVLLVAMSIAAAVSVYVRTQEAAERPEPPPTSKP